MIPAGQILDRGRLVLGLLLVAPLGVLLPAMGRPGAGAAGEPAPRISATTPTPIAAAAPSAQDIVAKLTNATVGPVPASGATIGPSTPGTGSDSTSSQALVSGVDVPPPSGLAGQGAGEGASP